MLVYRRYSLILMSSKFLRTPTLFNMLSLHKMPTVALLLAGASLCGSTWHASIITKNAVVLAEVRISDWAHANQSQNICCFLTYQLLPLTEMNHCSFLIISHDPSSMTLCFSNLF